MSMKAYKGMVGGAATKADQLIDIGLDLNTFINKHEAGVIAIRVEIGKPLDTVTTQDVQDYFGVPLSAAQVTASKKFFGVLEDLIQVIKPIKDKLPANDLEE